VISEHDGDIIGSYCNYYRKLLFYYVIGCEH